MAYILIPMGEKRGVKTLKKTNTRKSSDFFNVVKVGKSLGVVCLRCLLISKPRGKLK